MDPPASGRGIKRSPEETSSPATPIKKARTNTPTTYETPFSENTAIHHVGPYISKATEDMSANERALHEEAKRTQEALLELLRQELSGALYESSSLLTSFCPDHGRTQAVIDRLLENRWITVRNKKVGIKDWPLPSAGERAFYTPFRNCLDAIVTAFKQEFPNVPSYWVSKKMAFHVYDKEMHEKVEFAAPIKPDILSTLGSVGPFIGHLCSWLDVEIPGELKKDWKPMIAQAASYARCIFASADNRYFVPVFTLQYQSAQFRLAVFHRGGLLASKPMKLPTHEGFSSFVSTIVGMLSWASSAQAGYQTGQSHSHFKFNNSLYRIELAICRRNIVRGRGTRIFLLSLEPDNRLRKLDVKRPSGSVTSEPKILRLKDLDPLSRPSPEAPSDNIQLPVDSLPHRFILKCSHPLASRDKEEDIFASVDKYIGIVNIICGYDADQIKLPDDMAPWNLVSTPPSTRIECRLHRHILIRDIGEPLSASRGPKELALALLHAMIGHCALFYEGNYLHRDISNGNILLLSNEDQRLVPPLLNGIVPSGRCIAVLIDGDVAKRWGASAEVSSHRSGTKPFVSRRVSDGWRYNQGIIHTPLDDLESFFWVLLYTVLSQIPPPKRTEVERLWWMWLTHDSLAEVDSGKTSIVNRMHKANWSSGLSKYWEVFNGLLSNWRELSERGQKQLEEMEQLDLEVVKESSKEAYIDFIKAGVKHVALLPDDWPALE